MRQTFMVVAIVLITGCSSSETSTTTRSARDPITADEIKATNLTNLYDVVKKLRPMFLTSRGRTSVLYTGTMLPSVFLDGQRYGEIESLRSIPAAGVQEVSFLDARDATTQYGTGYPHGIILVVTWRK